MDKEEYKAYQLHERNKRKYLVLEMLLNGRDTSFLAKDCQHIASNLKKLGFEEQKTMLEKWSDHAPKPIDPVHAAMKFERLIGHKAYNQSYVDRYGY
jgi:hypothetical protein